jgi:putative membrane protein
MATSALFAFLHFLAVFGVFATLFLQWQTMSPAPTRAEALRIQRCDRWYGMFAMMLVVVGLLRVYWFEKGSAFYFGNPFFNLKLTLFVLVGLISIYPTVRFIKWRAQMRQGAAPVVSAAEHRRILWVLRAELVLLLGAAICASLMARGVGL